MRYLLILLVSFSLQAKERPTPEVTPEMVEGVVYLKWMNDPTTTMTVRWISSEKHSRLFFESEALNSTSSPLPEGHPYWLHTVELTELEPNTSYSFSLNGSNHKFKTLPKTLETLKFVEGGDLFPSTIQRMVKMHEVVAKHSPAFAVLGGDLAYSTTKELSKPENFDRWINFFLAWKKHMVTPDGHIIPIVTTIGNEDVKGGRYHQKKSSAPFYYTFFDRSTFAFDVGDYLSILFLDSGLTNEVSGKQTAWLDKALKKRQDVPYRFAVYHIAAYPSYRAYSNPRAYSIRQSWVPLFTKYQLTVIFEHDDHLFKRTVPIGGNIYLGDGGWGAKARKTDPLRPYLAKTEQESTATIVTLSPKSASIEIINDDGKVVDSIKKSPLAFLETDKENKCKKSLSDQEKSQLGIIQDHQELKKSQDSSRFFSIPPV